RCEDFLADVRRAGCETSVKGVPLELYSLRHAFATAARRAGLSSDARDRLLGHRPRDTKALHYEEEDLPLLAAEVAKLPRLLDPVPRTNAPTPSSSQVLVPVLVTGNLHASGASSLSLTISAEEERFELPEGLHPRRFSKPLP